MKDGLPILYLQVLYVTRDNTSAKERRRNEQSMQLCVEDLIDRDARAVFKNVSQDFVNYGKVKMFLHADSQQDLAPGEVTSFLRIGTDFTENYYEIEVPPYHVSPKCG